MKKIYLTIAAFVTVALVSNEASAQYGNGNGNRNNNWNNGRNKQPQKQRSNYYYYPQSNVYYSPATRDYWYSRNGAWVRADRLPRHFSINNQPRYEVWYDGYDDHVWNDNRNHYDRYRQREVVVQQPNRPGVRVDIHRRH
jgi:hypothetical protein